MVDSFWNILKIALGEYFVYYVSALSQNRHWLIASLLAGEDVLLIHLLTSLTPC